MYRGITVNMLERDTDHHPRPVQQPAAVIGNSQVVSAVTPGLLPSTRRYVSGLPKIVTMYDSLWFVPLC